MKYLTRLLLLLLGASLLLPACGSGGGEETADASDKGVGDKGEKNSVVILFDGDVHGALDGYPKIASFKRELLKTSPNVALVSTGDFLQGSPLLSSTKGMGVVSLVNGAGYDLIVPGSHDFDFGLDRLRTIADSLKAPLVLCNLSTVVGAVPVFQPRFLKEFGDVKVGFLGVTNPAAQVNNSPASYLGPNGELVYTFNSNRLYDMVQKNVDALRSDGADYVILLSHMGNSRGTNETIDKLLSRTHGIDAVLDSHDHKTVSERMVKDEEGKKVLVSSTGARFQYIGMLTIGSRGQIASRLMSMKLCQESDNDLTAQVDSLLYDFRHSPPIGYTFFQLQGYDKAGHYNRNVQTNLASLCADAMRSAMGTDIGWINAGAVMSSINKGDITMMDLLSVCPYGNEVCAAEVTGRQILDGLEFCTSKMPQDFSNYPVVSGIYYSVDTNKVSSVIIDELGFLAGFKDESRRVSHVTIYDAQAHGYVPVVPEKIYTVASVDYILKNHGSGNIFNHCKVYKENELLDIQAVRLFLEQRNGGLVSEGYNYKK